MNKDNTFLKEANEYIAHGALTNSKRPSCFVEGVYPTHARNGYGAILRGVNNVNYVDFICGLGTNWFGYGNYDISRSLVNTYSAGACLSLSSTEEITLAKILCKSLNLERLRFCKTGTEACMAAVRVARAAHPDRHLILSQGYHGWSNEFVSLTPPHNGIPPHIYIEKIEDVYDYTILQNAACVILEPVIVDNSRERIAFLKKLQEDCRRYGTLLIFDETITGYRYRNLSVALEHGLDPDISIFGKAIGGGMPLALFGGKSQYMDLDYFVSGSYFGERLSLVAAIEASKLLKERYHPNLIWEKAAKFVDDFNKAIPSVQMVGYPTRGIFTGDKQHLHLLMQECCKCGILFGPSWFIYPSLVEYLPDVLENCKVNYQKIIEGRVSLEGSEPKPTIIQKARNL